MQQHSSSRRLQMLSFVFLFSVLLSSCMGNPDSNSDHHTNVSAPRPINKDSIALRDLRDSLRNARPQVMGSGSYASSALDRMNVLYIGVDNPITINTFGFSPDKLEVQLAGGTLTASSMPGKYIARVTGGTQAILTINSIAKGSEEILANETYRVKRIPDPVAYFGNIKGDGQMTKAELQNTSGVFAKMENFDFDVSYKVVSFVMVMNVNGVWVEKKADGPAVTPDMKAMMDKAKTGDRVIIEQVVVQGPDGTLRKVPGVGVKVK